MAAVAEVENRPATMAFKRFPWTLRDGRTLDIGGIGRVRVVRSRNGSTQLEIEVPTSVVVGELKPAPV